MFSWYPFKRKFDEPSHHGTECEEGEQEQKKKKSQKEKGSELD